MIMKSINLSVMTEFDARRTDKLDRETGYGTERGIYKFGNKISREKLAWIIGDSDERCRKHRACNFPSKFNFY